MKKIKGKANTAAEKEFVFEFKAAKHNCVLKVPVQFPVRENINDLHGRLMLLHKIPCYLENGESSSYPLSRLGFDDPYSNIILYLSPKHKHLCVSTIVTSHGV